MSPGGLRGLQIRWGAFKALGGFDSHTLPPVSKYQPMSSQLLLNSNEKLLNTLLNYSFRTVKFTCGFPDGFSVDIVS